jgi:hypothetical protein
MLSCQAFLVVVLIYLGFHSLSSQLFLEDAPLALGSNFGPSVEFWVRLPLLKTQVHVVITLGMTNGFSTKTPLTYVNVDYNFLYNKSHCCLHDYIIPTQLNDASVLIMQ